MYSEAEQAVQMSVSQDLIEFDNLEHPVSEYLLIEKNQWGHVNIHVSTEGDFLSVYKKTVTDEDFFGEAIISWSTILCRECIQWLPARSFLRR